MENKRIDDFIEMLAELSTYLTSIKFRNAEMQQKAKISEAVENYLDGFSIARAPMRNVNDALQLNMGKREELGIEQIFTEKEIDAMPRQIKKLLIIEKKRCRIRQHPNKNGYEIRLRSNGYNVSASGITIEIAKDNFVKKLKSAKPMQNACNVVIPNTFNAFATYFFENFRKEKLAHKTFKADLNRYNNYLRPFFKEKPLLQITPFECQQLLKSISASGKGKTADEIFSILSIIFKGAIKHSLIEKNPLDVVYYTKHERKHGSAFTPEEEKTLRAQVLELPDERVKLGIALMLYTGLRPNELKTARVDGVFIVAVNSKRKHKRIEYKKIPIIKALKPFVAEGINVLFSDRALDKMRSIIKTLFPNHILYDLRTTFYSRCKEYDVAESARCAFVGHSLGEIGNAYTDLSNEYLIKEAKKLDAWEV